MFKEYALKLVAQKSLNVAKESANSACIFVGYQEKSPKSVDKLRKK